MLRPYQQEAVAAITEGLADGGLGQVHMACGSGKTLTAQRAAERLLPDGGTVAVLAPSLALVAQTLASWQAQASAPLGRMLAVCSDDTVVDAPVHTTDLPGDVTTSTDEIRAWLEVPDSGIRLIAGTYASAERLADAVRGTGRPLGLLVLDEAHHLAGRPDPSANSVRRVMNQAWLPARRRLFMTATPRIDAASAERHGHLSMDDRTLFGPVLYTYPFSRAIAEGYLEDYRLLVVGVSDREARALLADTQREYVDAPGAQSLQTMVAQAALVKASRLHGLRRVLSFHPRVDHAAEFARSLPGVARLLGMPEPYAAHVHGEMDHQTRARLIDRLRTPPLEGWTVLSNARCLGEGVDVPAVDGIVFAHPKRSSVDIVQAVGRALRRHPDTPGPSTVIVPVVVPDEDGEIGDLDAGDYSTLWQVVRALRAHDEPLGLALDTRRSSPSTHNPQLPAKITVVLPDGTSRTILDKLTVLTVRQVTSPWWEGYGRAAAFRGAHGHLLVRSGYRSPDGHRLGTWLNQQRSDYRKGWLAADRVTALEDLGIEWEPVDARWQLLMTAARAYQAEHGHLRVPTDYTTPDGYPLGKQLSIRRSQQNCGELNPAWAADLTRLGMVWGALRTRFWDTHDRLARYLQDHGHLDVPASHVDPDGYKLGSRIRKLRSTARGTLSAEESAALDRLGFRWSDQEQRADLITAVEHFHTAHGHAEIPADYEAPGTPARPAGWLVAVVKGERRLARAEAARLRAVGVTVPGQADPRWEANLAALRAYRAEYGHLDVPTKYRTADGSRLGSALVALRYKYRQGQLSADRVAALEELGVVWSPREEQWEDFLAACDRHIQEYGHLRVRVDYVDAEGFPLGAKIVFYRGLAKGNSRGELSPERRTALDARGMVWDARTSPSSSRAVSE
ncbi:Helicase associated domain protein [Streptomyces sp. NPDC047987]|uniref:DEAD/DEAH box helicase n=1 Tax=unclassified Streptomyces TaxID=2593676 RepID=UPI0034244E8A